MIIPFALLTALTAGQPAASPAPSRSEQTETCLACDDDAALAVTLPSGESRSLQVDAATFATSVHGDKLTCVDCHADITEVPHQARAFRTKGEFSLAYYENCKRCHFANYTKTLDSVHFGALARGARTAPLCVDCHGARDVARPNRPRTRVSGISQKPAPWRVGRGLVGREM